MSFRKGLKTLFSLVLAFNMLLPNESLSVFANDEIDTSIVDKTNIEQPLDNNTENTVSDTDSLEEPVLTEEMSIEENVNQSMDELIEETIQEEMNEDLNEEEEPVKEDVPEKKETHADWTDGNVFISVDGDIPQDTTLGAKEINVTDIQYGMVSNHLQTKAENEEYDIAGFVAYDIYFIDCNGIEREPTSPVTVSIHYGQPVLAPSTEDTDITVMHLQENNSGEVLYVEDLQAVTTVAADGNANVSSVAFTTNSFSIYTITWRLKNNKNEEPKDDDLALLNARADQGGIIVTPGTVTIPFTKQWDDNSDENGVRPSSLTINLYKYITDTFNVDNATFVETKTITGPDWNTSFDISNEDIYEKDGAGNYHFYKYAVVETPIENYIETSHTDPNVSFTPPSVGTGWTRHEPCNELNIANDATGKTVVISKKGNNYIVWTPDSLTIGEQKFVWQSAVDSNIAGFGQGDYAHATFISGFNGSYGGLTVGTDTLTYEDEHDWSLVYWGLYQKSTAEANASSITNKYVMPKTNVTITKKWDDNQNQDGIRPESITVKLIKNGQDEVGTQELTEENRWTYTFTELPKYEAGQEIAYSICEVTVDGYKTQITGSMEDGYIITNTHIPENITITVNKTWIDNDDAYNTRTPVTVNVMNGREVADTLTLTAENRWSDTTLSLPKYSGGKLIEYTIEEVSVDGYKTDAIVQPIMEIGKNTYEVQITNTLTGKITIQTNKTWIDNDNAYNTRTSVTVNVMNGREVVDTLTLTKDNDWSATSKELSKYDEDGKLIEYTIEEVSVDGYKTDAIEQPVMVQEEDTYTVQIKNKLTGTIKIHGTKTWKDNDDNDKVRPKEIKVTIMNGREVVQEITVTPNLFGKWSYESDALDKYDDNGMLIDYTVKEEAVKDYETEEVQQPKMDKDINEYTVNITNTHESETREIKVMKKWVDDNNKDKLRPGSVIIKLMANGKDTGKKLVLSEKNSWTGSFTDLPVKENGKEINYTVEEVEVKGYKVTYGGNMTDGFKVLNKHTTGTPTAAHNGMNTLFGGMSISLAGASVALYLKKKEDEEDDE